ncbi:MAG: hypothetical protein H7A06_04750 [Pseudomonadales bacterium]|nr:hypothetical protein [Pseudomonadales bacterium]
MLRKLVVVFTSVVLFAAAHAKALGLGEIVLESSLNQPLDARIALLQLGNVRPEQIQVQMAGEDDFARFSVQRVAFLDNVRFDVQSSGADAIVRLRTDEAVREPYLSFVLETRWPSGRLLSEYTVLLDLPPFAATGNAAPVQQPVQAPSPVQTVQNQQVAQVSSSAPERLAAAPASEPEPVAVPAEEPVSVAAEPAPVPEPAAQPAQPTRAASATAESVTIGTNDTLWDVALRVRPDSSVSVQQTMLALQSLNREAFISDNINMVRRGQVLRVPTLEQIRALSAREAMSEVARQNQLFDNRRNVPLASQPVTAQPQATGGPGRGELTVVSSDNAEPASAQSSGSGQSAEQTAALDAQIASLEDALAVQREEADRAALLNAELTERLGLLEQQIASAQEIIRLRDLELAQLQQSLAEAAAAEPEPVDPPTVITMAPEKTLVEQILDTLVANTYALLALVALVILMLVVVLLRRNRAAEQEAALAGMEGMPVEDGEMEGESGDEQAAATDDESPLTADVSDDELDEIMSMAGTADAALMSHDDEDESADSEDLLSDDDFDLAEEPAEALAPEESEEEQPLVLDAFDEDEPEEAPAAAVSAQDVLEEADALIAYEKFDEAESLLRDAIVAEPDRVDLRMKLLEAYVGKQDAVGFKLQETEIRDMGVGGVEPRIATLRAQLHDETDSEILEEGEDDFFNELNALDDMEVALDLEASAEVDDDKVLSGAVSEDEPVQQEPAADIDSNDIDFDFAPDDDEPADTMAEDTAESDDGIELSFSAPDQPAEEQTLGGEDEIEGLSLSSDFDLSDTDVDAPATEDAAIEDIESISFDLQDDEPAPAEAASALEEPEQDENAIDFDFDFAVDEPESAVPEDTEETAADVEEEPESDENDIDFDFAVIDEDQASGDSPDIEVASAPAENDASIELADDDIEFDLDLDADAEPEDSPASVEFDLDSDDDAEIEFLDDEEGDSKAEFRFDDAHFDLSPEADAGTAPAQDTADTFDDLQFVDDNLEQDDGASGDTDAEDDEDLDFLSDTDEAATKLDLARAYFEMGDKAGAREILEEVVKEGNEEQVKDANELLGKL